MENVDDALTEAAFDHVTEMIPRADDPWNLMWYGWALRGAFIAGAKWQKEHKDADSKGTSPCP